MGGGGTPQAPSPVAVPSAADEEAAEERARLYSLLRSRRGGSGLAYGAPKRYSLLATKRNKTTGAAALDVPYDPFTAGGGTGGTGPGIGGDSPGTGSGYGGPSGENPDPGYGGDI